LRTGDSTHVDLVDLDTACWHIVRAEPPATAAPLLRGCFALADLIASRLYGFEKRDDLTSALGAAFGVADLPGLVIECLTGMSDGSLAAADAGRDLGKRAREALRDGPPPPAPHVKGQKRRKPAMGVHMFK
jgi:hypothetical protein